MPDATTDSKNTCNDGLITHDLINIPCHSEFGALLRSAFARFRARGTKIAFRCILLRLICDQETEDFE